MLDVREQQKGGFRAFAARDAERQAAKGAVHAEGSAQAAIDGTPPVSPAASGALDDVSGDGPSATPIVRRSA